LNLVRFLYNKEELSNKYEIINFATNGNYYFFWFVVLFATFTTATDFYQIYNQIICIYNDVSYYEYLNNQFDYDYYYPFINVNNLTKDVNTYNKIRIIYITKDIYYHFTI